jgi:hypothetical protein
MAQAPLNLSSHLPFICCNLFQASSLGIKGETGEPSPGDGNKSSTDHHQ